MDDNEKKIQEYSDAIEKGGNLVESFMKRGKMYYFQTKYDSALFDFTKVIQLDPKHIIAYTFRGIVYKNIKKYDLAIKDFTKVIQLDPKNIIAYYDRGFAYDNIKKYDLAIKDYTKIIQLDAICTYAYINRGIVYIEIKEYDLAIKDLTKAIQLDPENIKAYLNRGICYSDIEEYNWAIKDFTRVVHLNIEYSDAYFGLAVVYNELNDHSKKELNFNLFLYYSYINDELKIKNYLLSYWKNTPYNLVFILEKFNIDYTYTRAIIENNSLHKIQDIEDYSSFLSKYQLNSREKESNRAILNYHLGSPVASFIQYDEVLDTEDYLSLKPQELYYYALSAYTIQVEATTILKDCIDQLLKNNALIAHEEYYLGQLYILNKEVEKAYLCFENTKEFAPSLLMLVSLEESPEKKQLLFNQLITSNSEEIYTLLTGCKKKPIHITHSFQEQFQQYFYTREVLLAVHKLKKDFRFPDDLKKYNNIEFWEAFYLTDIEREKLQLKLREKEITEIIDHIAQEIQVNTSDIDVAGRVNYLKNIEDSLLEKQKLPVKRAFKELLETQENKKDIENHLGQIIEAFELEHSKLYLYFISYFYFNSELDSYQSFALFVYLIDTVCSQKSSTIKDSIRTIIPPDHSKLFLTSIGLSGNLFGIVNVVKAIDILLSDYEAYELREETHYMSFKKNIWKYISLNKETLSEEKFKNKFLCFPAILNYNLEKL